MARPPVSGEEPSSTIPGTTLPVTSEARAAAATSAPQSTTSAAEKDSYRPIRAAAKTPSLRRFTPLVLGDGEGAENSEMDSQQAGRDQSKKAAGKEEQKSVAKHEERNSAVPDEQSTVSPLKIATTTSLRDLQSSGSDDKQASIQQKCLQYKEKIVLGKQLGPGYNLPRDRMVSGMDFHLAAAAAAAAACCGSNITAAASSSDAAGMTATGRGGSNSLGLAAAVDAGPSSSVPASSATIAAASSSAAPPAMTVEAGPVAVVGLEAVDPPAEEEEEDLKKRQGLRSAIHKRYPPGMPMKIGDDSTFRQMAGLVRERGGNQVDFTGLTGAECLRQVLPAGTNFGRGIMGLYRAGHSFLKDNP